MARFLDPTYDPRNQSGTSGAEVTDLNPEQAYDTDIRRLDETERVRVLLKDLDPPERRGFLWSTSVGPAPLALEALFRAALSFLALVESPNKSYSCL